MRKENPLTERLLRKGVFFLVLTAREPSVKPLADVVRCYICCDGQHKSGNTRHFSHFPSHKMGGQGRKTIITYNSPKRYRKRGREPDFPTEERLCLSTTSQSASQTAPLVGEPLAKPFTLRGLPRPLLPGEVARRQA